MSDNKHKEKREKQTKDKKKPKRERSDSWSKSSSSSSSRNDPVVNDELALAVQAQWQEAFPGSTLLPVIGLPSNNNGVATLTHTAGEGHKMRINGLVSNSPLANNALYTFEAAQSEDDHDVVKYLNLYEIMIPELPGKNGRYSTSEYYVKLLHRYGLSVAGVHFHWWGQKVIKGNTLVAAIHHQGIGISPEDFSRKTIKAIQKTDKLIEKRKKDNKKHNGNHNGKKH